MKFELKLELKFEIESEMEFEIKYELKFEIESKMEFESEFEMSTMSRRSQKTKLDGTNRTKSELLPNCVFLEKKSFP